MFRRLLARGSVTKIYPLLVLLLLPLLVFYRATIGTDIFALGDFSGSDLLELHLPFKYILHDAYTHGEIPMWTPYLSNGFPVLAEGQSGALYPPNVAMAFLPPYLALNYSILLALIVAGTGAYAFAMRLPGSSRYGALICGLVFMFSSFFIARMKHINMIAVAAYLPWCLWIVSRSLKQRSNRTVQVELLWYVMLGCVWALQIYAGHPHMFYFCILMTLWFAVGEIVRLRLFQLSTNISSIILSIITGFFLAGVVGVGLSAAQLLATFELTQLSSRLQYTYETATSFPLRPAFLASLFAPFFLGNPATGGYRGDIRVDGIWWENVLYIGLLPLVLVIVTLILRIKNILHHFFVKSGTRYRSIFKSYLTENLYYFWFFFLSAIVYFLLSCGDLTSLFSIAYYNLPGMQLFRFPTRFNLFTLFSLAVIVGMAVERALIRLERSRIEGTIKREDSSDYVFSWPFPPKISRLLVFLVILVDLIVFAYQYIGFFPQKSYLSIPESVGALQKDSQEYRIYPTTQYSQNPFKEIGWKSGAPAIYSLQTAIPGNYPAVYHLRSFTDRGWFEGGLGIAARHRLEKVITDNSIPPVMLSKVLGMWNVKYLIGFYQADETTFRTYAQYTLEKSFGQKLSILENQYVLPRAYFTSRLRKVDSEDSAFEEIFSSTFRPELDALTTESIQEKDLAPIKQDEFDSMAFRESNPVSIVQKSASQIVMKAKTEEGGYLVLTDSYYPGWKSYIDGTNSPIYQVNIAQQAVYVDKGSHTIIWAYEPEMFYLGACISIAMIVCCICVGIFAFKRRGVAAGE